MNVIASQEKIHCIVKKCWHLLLSEAVYDFVCCEKFVRSPVSFPILTKETCEQRFFRSRIIFPLNLSWSRVHFKSLTNCPIFLGELKKKIVGWVSSFLSQKSTLFLYRAEWMWQE